MILLDTSVWVDHLRRPSPAVTGLLRARGVVMHSAVLGEILLGNVRNRVAVERALSDIPRMRSVADAEVLQFIEINELFGTGIGFVDAHLLAACLVDSRSYLWTIDRRLLAVAARLGIDATSA